MPVTLIIGARTHNVSPGDVPAYLRHHGLTELISVGSRVCVEAGLMLGEQTWVLTYPEIESEEYALYFLWDENEEANTRVIRWVAKWQDVLGGTVMAPRWTDVSTRCVLRGYDPAKLRRWLYDWMVENFADDRIARLTRDFVS